MNVYSVESVLISFVMYASHQSVKHVTKSGISIKKEETTILKSSQCVYSCCNCPGVFTSTYTAQVLVCLLWLCTA